MNIESILKSLDVFNLSSYEAKAYLALLEKEVLSPVEVATISGVPRGRVYEILNKLLEKGFCFLVPGAGKQYKAMNPEVFQERIETKIKNTESEIEEQISKLKSEIEEKKKNHDWEMNRKKDEFNARINRLIKDFDFRADKDIRKFNLDIDRKERQFDINIKKKKRALDDLKRNTNDVVGKLIDVYKKGRNNDDPIDYIEVIKDFEQVNRRIIQLIKNSKQEILSFTKSKIITKASYRGQLKEIKKDMDDQCDSLIEALKRGVEVRGIYELSPDPDINWVPIKNIEAMINAGQKVRLIQKLPFQMLIIDMKTILFNLESTVSRNLSDTSQIICHQGLSWGHKILFDTLWNQAEDYNEYKKRMKF